MHSTVTDKDSAITLVINSTSNKDNVNFSVQGTTLYIPQISIRWGCFSKNTELLLADGTKKVICEIKTGDQLASNDGKLHEVVNIYTGYEKEIIRITDVLENHLYLTGTHPIN
ncbi:MAG: Hint domain-containing homing endonuclease [Velocimicrobium sp.]